ncbi:MAG TPA: ABC transporter ATP-binding protein [Candidatus Brocadiia bacterium]|nr:ABC transporter ATP-binding protein [Candidatus Brocadiia bacterium]
MPIAEIIDLRKTYLMGSVEVHALTGVNLTINEGDYVAIMGASGSGKSTLLTILGCLARPTSGRYLLGGQDVSGLSDDELSDVRCRRIGFIFQSYNLIQQLTVLENIEVPLYYQGWSERESRERAEKEAELVGLKDRLRHRPYELSGGQQQRVAIARALAAEPLILLADEPTGNLDSATGREILDLLHELHENGRTLIVVTHDASVGELAQRTVTLADGQVASIVER